jgi:cytochrome c553
MKRLILMIFMLHSSCWALNSLVKLPVCATCHGLDGAAPQEIWPNLSGQSQNYMLKQLLDFKHNRRISPVMQTYAALLNEQEMLELSKYYSKKTLKASLPDSNTNKKGKELYRVGNFKKKIPACIACHGPSGNGNDPAKYPKISQQHPAYLLQQLKAFKQHQRTNDPHKIMQDISSKLDDAEIRSIVKYLKTLH